MTGGPSRGGIVLPVVLVILVLLELLAAGTLALAYQESVTAQQRGQAQRAAFAARTGSTRVSGTWAAHSWQQLPVGATASALTGSIDPFTSFSASVERLSGELYLIRAEGRSGTNSRTESRARTSFLVAAHDITRIAGQFPAAAGFAGPVSLTGGATIDGFAADDAPTGWSSEECRQWLLPVGPAPGLARGTGATVDATGTSRIDGDPPRQADPGLTDPEMFGRLGTLTLPVIAALADRTESGTVRLEPSGGAAGCDVKALGNWGAPLDSSHECAGFFPLIYAPGNLAVSSGAGQGILVVEGDLTLNQGVQFFGIALVRGRLLAGPGAALQGAALIGSTSAISMLHGASIRRCNCAIARALTRSPALNQPVARRGRSWLPAF